MTRSLPRLLLALGLFALSPFALAQDASSAPVDDAAELGDDLQDADLEVDSAASADDAMPPAAMTAPAVVRDPTAADPAPADPTLRPVFDQFGGREGLVALMEDFMAGLLADPRTRAFFIEADQAAIKAHLVDQFCAILGGGCVYDGRDMKSAHAGMGVDRAAFNALVEDLQVAMDKRDIPFRAQNQLLARLAPMHREIEGSAAP